MLQEWLNNKIVVGALTGLGAAVLVDFVEFRKWKSFNEAVHYDWSTASWRWFQGVVAGAVAALGLDSVA